MVEEAANGVDGRRAPPKGALRVRAIAPEVYWLPVRGCNVYLVGSAPGWVLIDTGWPDSAERIRQAAAALFGPSARPEAILLTHAHPDHFGSAAELARVWNSPIYAHHDDLPYTEGGVLPDSLLDPVGRVFAVVERLLPARTVARITTSRLKGIVQALPGPGGAVPGLPDWEYLHVPGHSPGHLVFFRRRDRVLVAGDVVLTAPLWGLLPALQKLSLPPWISSWDWKLTKEQVATISRLEPSVLATGHGAPLVGDKVAGDLAAFGVKCWQVNKTGGGGI
jgi:glyoxylase-like metal-dependent hydrolase (beta-lactamase superfamily II)